MHFGKESVWLVPPIRCQSVAHIWAVIGTQHALCTVVTAVPVLQVERAPSSPPRTALSVFVLPHHHAKVASTKPKPAASLESRQAVAAGAQQSL